MASANHPAGHLIAATIRSGYPNFLDLPWGVPLADWHSHSSRVMDLPRGISRHPVVFVEYDNTTFAVKELPPRLAEREFETLREMEERRLPVVTAVGYAQVRRSDEPASILITRFLDRSLPYHALFMRSPLMRYRDHLLDAMALLLVQLHLAGVFWGDCSLSNTLFRRDAGRLTAYLVDAETSEIYPALSDARRMSDLEIMEDNVGGGLLDLEAMQALPRDFPVKDIGPYIRQRYEKLWAQVMQEEVIPSGERYRIEQRVQALNQLGFSVEKIVLSPAEGGDVLRLRATVTDRNFHRDMLHSLTGLSAEEMQARILLNEIGQMQAQLSREQNRSVAISAAAHRWLHERYLPTVARLGPLAGRSDAAEFYCEVLEHKWYMSERMRQDVGHAAAASDFLKQFGVVYAVNAVDVATRGMSADVHGEPDERQSASVSPSGVLAWLHPTRARWQIRWRALSRRATDPWYRPRGDVVMAVFCLAALIFSAAILWQLLWRWEGSGREFWYVGGAVAMSVFSAYAAILAARRLLRGAED